MRFRDDWEFRGLVHQVTDEAVFDQLDAGSITAYIGLTRPRHRCTSVACCNSVAFVASSCGETGRLSSRWRHRLSG